MKHPSIRTLGIVTVSLMMATRARGAAAPLSPDAMVAAHPLTGAELGSRTSGGDTPGQTRSSVIQGRRLFTKETFGGNGRSCESCHDLSSGTTSPADAQALYAESESHPGNDHSSNLLDPLFRPIDSDDGVGDSYDRLLRHATIRVVIDLPAYMTNVDDPSARSVVLNRGIPSVINSALLLPVLMLDGRESTLQKQALDAVIAHAEPSRLPAASQQDDISNFESTLFSRPELADYFHGGPAPELPQGTTPSEARGRTFFMPGGACNTCHSGPMLNETSSGLRFANIFVSDVNRIGNPVYHFRVENQDGTVDNIETPDPGLALTQPEAPAGQYGIYATANSFRIPTLWNVKATAPYFHDNSADTLEDVLAHYRLYLFLTDQDVVDIIAYLKLL